MFNRTTEPLRVHANMTCSCAQCQLDRSAQTAMFPRLTQPRSTEGMLFEIVTAIDSETGKETIYYWPIRQVSPVR